MKYAWVHPDLPGYVIKTRRQTFAGQNILRKEVLTMVRLQNLVDQENLTQIVIPASYFVTDGNEEFIVQQEIKIQPTEDPQPEFNTLIQAVDKRWHPLVPDALKSLPGRLIARMREQILPKNGPYTAFEEQLMRRVWIWDLDPATGHNCGIHGSTGRLAIFDASDG